MLNSGMIYDTIALTDKYLKEYFQIKSPRIAVCGLNPHAGEGGSFGSEEAKVIIPAIKKASRSVKNIDGPLPADIAFYAALKNKYDAVIMDPPKFGRGPKGETWNIEKDLPKLLSGVRKILSDKPLFVILNSYAIDSSSLSLGYALEDAMKGLKGEVISGELCLLEKSKGRNIPLSNTAIFC